MSVQFGAVQFWNENGRFFAKKHRIIQKIFPKVVDKTRKICYTITVTGACAQALSTSGIHGVRPTGRGRELLRKRVLQFLKWRNLMFKCIGRKTVDCRVNPFGSVRLDCSAFCVLRPICFLSERGDGIETKEKKGNQLYRDEMPLLRRKRYLSVSGRNLPGEPARCDAVCMLQIPVL